ncbi:MAG: DUF4097 family beta strand repeat protein [Prolixibacteraceae bacterium]|nr:DUF4097 family beta strand repeat protein [Prolixibacteraceae bacterium]
MKTQLTSKMYLIFAAFALLISCNGIAQDDRTPSLSKTFEQNQPGNLYARSSGGSVTILTHDQQQVVINLFIRKNGRLLPPSDPEIEDVLELYDFNIEKKGTDITAVIKRKADFNMWRNAGISLQIIVPEEMSCDASSSGGGLKASGVTGRHQFSSSGGSVHLENITGNTKASSSGGRVKVLNHNGNIEVSSSGGEVSLEGGKGDIKAHSSGGGVHLIDINGDVEASNSGGGVKVTGEAGYLKATSSGGSVRVDIDKLSKELYLRSSGGGIDATIHHGENLGLDLDLKADRVNVNLKNFSGRTDKDRILGTMNNGGIPVYMHSSGGNVNVSF